ncbi:hypothetical protein BG011_006573 [Mortierella polycephala]|uniref:Uncharacterized protein n=1 Tax=Mortierella polycephala TaxID=41804 RepID=A0A9P6PUZ4_9FUNG|nr:hypothetical protein BG011_006573 [Mortierella polycephala]
MASPIAPPASFGFIPGTTFTSASPEVLAKILDTLDLASLEQECSRLELAIQKLVQSNQEIADFIDLDQQEMIAHLAQVEGGAKTTSVPEPDPEFVLAMEENKEVVAKYEKTCAELKLAIQKRRGEGETSKEQDASSEASTVEDAGAASGGKVAELREGPVKRILGVTPVPLESLEQLNFYKDLLVGSNTTSDIQLHWSRDGVGEYGRY